MTSEVKICIFAKAVTHFIRIYDMQPLGMAGLRDNYEVLSTFSDIDVAMAACYLQNWMQHACARVSEGRESCMMQ